jgi:glutamate synthase (NADPH/NADH) small chain
MDSARTALRLGAESVDVVYRRSRDEVPARLEEFHHAEAEGVKFNFLNNPVRISGDESFNVTGVECQRMELGEPDASGRRRPVAVEGSEHVIAADLVVMAIGQSPNQLVPQTTKNLNADKHGHIVVNEETLETSHPGVFAGGDVVTGAATVIMAMGAGKTAARSIDAYLQTLPPRGE